jgi:hypothetical protein
VVERVGARHVVHHDDAVGAAVVGRGDGAEPLLACRSFVREAVAEVAVVVVVVVEVVVVTSKGNE